MVGSVLDANLCETYILCFLYLLFLSGWFPSYVDVDSILWWSLMIENEVVGNALMGTTDVEESLNQQL